MNPRKLSIILPVGGLRLPTEKGTWRIAIVAAFVPPGERTFRGMAWFEPLSGMLHSFPKRYALTRTFPTAADVARQLRSLDFDDSEACPTGAQLAVLSDLLVAKQKAQRVDGIGAPSSR
jgi:hypothetical protein